MANAIYVKKARKDYPEEGIKKGDSYYWWKFNFGPKVRSKTVPRRSQLTQSAFLGQIYDIEDRLGALTSEMAAEDIKSELDTTVSELEEMQSEVQEKLDNMPEQLQESSSSGEMLTERVDSLDEWKSELETVECEVEEGLSKEDTESRMEEIIDEISNCNYNGS